jgi:hypothetical protein
MHLAGLPHSPTHAPETPRQFGSWDPVLFYLYIILEANMNMGAKIRGVKTVQDV